MCKDFYLRVAKCQIETNDNYVFAKVWQLNCNIAMLFVREPGHLSHNKKNYSNNKRSQEALT